MKDLATACPSLTIICDHCGGLAGPLSFNADATKEAEWRACITELATCPNVHMKVGGLQMVGNGFELLEDDVRAQANGHASATLVPHPCVASDPLCWLWSLCRTRVLC